MTIALCTCIGGSSLTTDTVIRVADKLSQGFPELRVDLYNVQAKIYFNELSFISQGGFMDFFTPEFNLELGN